MSDVTTYRVTPENGVWKIKLAGDGFTEWAQSKADAISRARVLAQRAPRGEVIVVDKEGTVETQFETGPPAKPS